MLAKDWDELNQAQYTNNVIIPLLKNMGYMEVTYNHGIHEFGRGIIFSEYDRFGNKKYNVAQIISVDISGDNQNYINYIIDHILNAFDVEFNDLITKEKKRISDFFMITSKTFEKNAKISLFENPKIREHVHRIHFYEGHHIKEFYERNFKNIKELLISQLYELERNTSLAEIFIDYLIDKDRKAIRIKFVNYNLPTLINKLSGVKGYESLLFELERYYFTIDRCNGTITLMPILNAIGGVRYEKREIISLSKEIINNGHQIASEIKMLLSENEA